MVYKRMDLKVESLAGLEGGSVSIAGRINIDGVEREANIVVDAQGWQRIARNVEWFGKTRPRVTTAIWDGALAAAKKCMPDDAAMTHVLRTHGPRPAESESEGSKA